MSFTRADDADLLTVEEYRSLPEEDYGDLVQGRFVREPRPGGRHGVLVGRLSARIGAYLEQHPVGILVTDGGFLLQQEPPTVRGPMWPW